MRSRSELFDILVDDLRLDKAKAIEIIENAFTLHDDEIKKRNEKIEELKEKFVGKLLYINSDDNLPVYVFVNDIRKTCSLNYFAFVGPHIILDENEYHFYSIEDTTLTVGENEFDKIECIKIVNDWDDDTEIDKHLFIHNYLYYQVCEKLVATALKKFINECKID